MAKEITRPDDVKLTSLKGTSFTETEAGGVKNRLICSIDGESGHGKNRLAFSFPDPIAFMSFDPNYKKALDEARRQKKRIHRAPYTMPVITPDGKDTERISKVAGDLWDQVATDFMGAVRDPKIETIVIDTATELFELIKLALYGKVVQVMQRDLGHAYATYRQFIREVENTSKNLVLIHKMKDEYRADKATGNRIRSGYKDTAYIVTTELLCDKVAGEPFPDRYKLFVNKCHLNPSIEWDGNGSGELSGDLISFDTLQELIFG